MCEYCEKSESLFYDKNSKDVREIVIEQDGTLSVFSNNYDYGECQRNEGIGFDIQEARQMAQFSYNIKINYCPMCGRNISRRENP